MVFTIDTSNFTSSYKKIIKSKIKINALQRLRYFPIRVSEKLLDKYLKENYNMTLLYACYLIILNSRVEQSSEEIKIFIIDKELDEIARVITFGTGRYLGSRIIPFIFGKI